MKNIPLNEKYMLSIKETELLTINNHDLIRTYSDGGFKIRKDGTDEIYDEAIDLQGIRRIYTETDEPAWQEER